MIFSFFQKGTFSKYMVDLNRSRYQIPYGELISSIKFVPGYSDSRRLIHDNDIPVQDLLLRTK